MTRSLAITAKKSPGDAFPCLANEVLNNRSPPSNFHRYFSLPMAHLTNISAVYLHKSSENLREKILYIFPTFSHSSYNYPSQENVSKLQKQVNDTTDLYLCKFKRGKLTPRKFKRGDQKLLLRLSQNHAQSQQVKRGSKLLFGYKPTNIHIWYFTRLMQMSTAST